MIAALDGKPIVPPPDIEYLGGLLAGFMLLTNELGKRLHGEHGRLALRETVADIQARARLEPLFGHSVASPP